jgi:hypothetical protein
MGPEVSCPACRRRIYITEAMIGRRLNCADCGTEFVAQVDPFSRPNFSGSDDFPGGGQRSGLRKPGSSSAARLALFVGAVVLLGGAGYFVYQHFFVDKHPALKAADMEALNYLPGSSQVVLGVDVGNSLARPEFAELFKKQLAGNKTLNLAEVLHNTLGLRLEDLDHVAAGFSMGDARGGIAPLPLPAGKVPETTSETLVLKTRLPYDRGRLLKKVKAGPAQKAQGKEYFRLPDSAGFNFLYLPADRMIVLAKVKKSRLGDILDLEGSKPALAEDVMALLRQVGKAHAWAVVKLNPVQQQLPVGVGPMGNILRSRAAGFWLKSQGDRVDLTVGLVCHDPQTARQLAGAFEQSKANLRQTAGLWTGNRHQEILDEIVKNLQFDHANNIFWGGTKVSITSLLKLPAFNPDAIGGKGRPGGKQKK